MDRHSNMHAQPGSTGPEDLSIEVLIGRIVDGEASAVDRAQFEEFAAMNSSVWKLLALRQQDAAALTARFEQHTEAVDRIELPVVASSAFRSLRGPWWFAAAGWAAVLALAVLWSVQRAGELRERQAIRAADQPQHMSPDEHLREYLAAPFVMGEWPPTLLHSERLSDGRTFIRMLRRIEETAYIDPDKSAPIGPDGRLTAPPEQIRGVDPSSSQPAEPAPN